jgi:UDP-N-acetylmuramyl pentapeptide phosphotransferase/UDP-N-acetylglucosamine-1-phosphate transferase
MTGLDRLRAPNQRGVFLPRTLWIPPMVGGIVTGVLGTLVIRASAEPTERAAPAIVATLACLIVTAAGLVDDLVPQRARGLRGHLRALADGHVTTGLLKAVITAGAAVVVMAVTGDRSIAGTLAGVVVLAASANVWNGLDVAPGRALKWYLLMMTAIVAGAAAASVGGWSQASVCAGVTMGAIVALPFDVRERAMLGDAGSNLLGFASGIAWVTVGSDVALVALAVGLVALNLVAETVTLSRVIDRAPPLRWFDRLGRLPEAPSTIAGP